MYTICYIAFFVLSTAAAFKNDKGNQMHFTDNQTRYTLPLLLRLVHTQRKCKKQDIAFAMSCLLAESEGLGSLRSPASLLRKLSYCKPLLTRLRLAKDCKGSNPVFTFKQKTGHSFCYALFFMAESEGFEPSVPLGIT